MTDHLKAILLHLSNERVRLANARTEGERQLRTTWVSQLEKEVAAEERFLAKAEPNLSDADILKALGA